ncbi:MAG: hypothetical protein ACXAEX_03020 [Promethearchaeota archaeon]|jgi:hypothetical protein
MMENQIFNLEKIKELTTSIDILQAKIYQLKDTSAKLEDYRKSAIQNIKTENFNSQIEILTNLINDIKTNLENVVKDNISNFLSFKDGLLKKYKERYQERLKRLNLNQSQLSKIGLNLIENRKISKTIPNLSYIPSIDVLQWVDILDSLKQNSLFLKSVKKIEIYYENIIQDRFKFELSKIPKDTDESLIENFKNVFNHNPTLSFKEFLQGIEENLTQKEIKTRRDIVSQAKEREDLEKLKKKQEEHKETYEDYLKLSDREFERKIRKKSRGKLNKISISDKEVKSIQMSEEVSEKIEKFKSKLDQSFEEKYLIQKDGEKDPLDLIRERKTKKEKEYKKFKNHFEND